jgi:hypothetical protein
MRTKLCAPGLALLALAGVWLSHTAEYVRVAGTAGLRDEMTGSLHLYMLPLGAVVAVLAVVGGTRCRRAWLRLGRRLDRAHTDLRRALRGWHPESVTVPASVTTSTDSGVLPVWLGLAAAQLSLYLLQENLEARLTGLAAPGISVLTGRHWAASIIHLAVALVLALAVVRLGRRVLRRAIAVESCERVIQTILRGRSCRVAAGPRTRWAIRPPLERFGRQLWGRPPPAASLAH